MTHSQLLPLEAKLSASWPPQRWCDVTMVIAVSGGADSVALLRALARSKHEAGGPGRLIVAHFNHHLRDEANHDAEFVRELADGLEIPFELGQGDVAALAREQSDGIEAAARAARYCYFQEVAERIGARYLVTAHTADDQVETVLFNLLRGTGISGLAGIQRARPLSAAVTLLRPMLEIWRSEVLEYLSSIDQPYRSDASNQSSEFTRNRIRHELLPFLRHRFNADVDQAICRLAQLAGDTQSLIDALAADVLDRATNSGDSSIAHANRRISIDVSLLAGLNRHLAREAFVALWHRMNWPLQNMGYSQWEALAELALGSPEASHEAVNNAKTLPGGVIAKRSLNQIVLSRQLD
jgi:tRNA(Ile)-lysidine synthase